MHISDVMSNNVTIADPKQSIQDAAKTMAELDAGSLPVGEGEQLVGMITDRDIAIRAVASGMSLDTTIDKIMTNEVKYCFEDDELEQIAANMAENKLRRLPVVNKQKRLVGIVSLGDISHALGAQCGLALADITMPGGRHSQHTDGGARPV